MMKIALIADDDEFFRIALKTILQEQLGFTEVVQASSMDEALEKLPDMPDCDIAIFDLAMPGLESPERLRAVRKFHPRMRVAVVSASTARSDILAVLGAGVHGYVPKGVGAAELAAGIQSVLDGSYVPPALGASEGEVGVFETLAERASLTGRQKKVLGLLVKGHSTKEIAKEMGISIGTVKIYLNTIYRILGVKNRHGAAVAGARLLEHNREGAD